MKKAKIVFTALVGLAIIAIALTSCTPLRDPWGNKQTVKERRALNQIGCPGNQGFIGTH